MKLYFVFFVYNINFNFMALKIKYKIYRLRVKMRKASKKELDLDDIQKRGYDIVISMIGDKNSNLLYDISKGRRAIENGNIWVEIKANKIRITNSISHDDVPIDDRISSDLINKFDSKMTRKFNAKENYYTNKTKDRLDGIKDDISGSRKDN